MFGRRKKGEREQAAHRGTSEDARDEQDLEEQDLDEMDLEVQDMDEDGDVDQLDLEAELARQAEEFGLTVEDPVVMYGPNGEAVTRLIDSLATVDLELAERIAEAWEAIPDAERKVVHRVLERRHRGGNLADQMWAAEQAVDVWLESRLALDDGEADLYREVAEAARDAVDALVLDAHLDDVDFATLYEPWAEAMESVKKTGKPKAAKKESVPGKAAGSKAKKGDEDVQDEAGEFGPNSGLVLDFLDRLDGLSPELTRGLVDAWSRVDASTLKSAHRHLAELVKEDPDWRGEVKRAQGRVLDWVSGAQPGASSVKAQIRQHAAPALADAVAALTLADVLEPEDAQALYAAWAEAVGRPELPTFEDEEPD
jgi:hypothetical protein